MLARPSPDRPLTTLHSPRPSPGRSHPQSLVLARPSPDRSLTTLHSPRPSPGRSHPHSLVLARPRLGRSLRPVRALRQAAPPAITRTHMAKIRSLADDGRALHPSVAGHDGPGPIMSGHANTFVRAFVCCAYRFAAAALRCARAQRPGRRNQTDQPRRMPVTRAKRRRWCELWSAKPTRPPWSQRAALDLLQISAQIV